MSTLPQVGTTRYGSFVFPVETETQSLTATPVQDVARRTIIHVVYSITLHSRLHIAAGSTMDATMDTVRKQLTAQASPLYYEDKGLGTISANVPGRARKDVVWGPVPKSLKLKPIGQNAVDLVWTVEVAVPECDAAQYEGRVMEYNYRLSFNIDTSGYQKRTYSGFVRIPMTRRSQGDRTIPWNIDEWRARIYPPLLAGFRRHPGVFTIDESKTRLDFSVEDEEVGPNFVPAGCVSATASHDYHTAKQGRFNQYVGTISAEYELVRGTFNLFPYFAFIDLVKSRVEFVKNLWTNGQRDPNSVKPEERTVAVVPLSFSASEPDIYGHTKAKFSLSYIVTTGIRAFLTEGLWEPVPNSDWSKWAKPLSAAAWQPNGNANLRFDQSQDAIIDLCLNAPTLSKMKSRQIPPIVQSLIRAIPNFGNPTPFNSWLLYENKLRIETQDTTVIHQPLATSKIGTPSGTNTLVSNSNYLNSANGFQGQRVNAPESIIQQRSAPLHFVVMEGRAVRVGYEIPQPKLLTLGGVPMFPYNLPGDGFSMGIVGNVGLPIYAAKWRLRYVLPRSPGTASPVPNPTVGGGSGTSTLRGASR